MAVEQLEPQEYEITYEESEEIRTAIGQAFLSVLTPQAIAALDVDYHKPVEMVVERVLSRAVQAYLLTEAKEHWYISVAGNVDESGKILLYTVGPEWAPDSRERDMVELEKLLRKDLDIGDGGASVLAAAKALRNIAGKLESQA